MSVGDVNSQERGSGARFNDGKPDMALIPLRIVAESFPHGPLRQSLWFLGRFQETQELEYLNSAIDRIKDHWPDCARVFEYGAKKYASWNWAKGMNWSVPLACAGRHALAVLARGETVDPESNWSHEGHYLCNLVMLKTFIQTFPEGNDLPTQLKPVTPDPH